MPARLFRHAVGVVAAAGAMALACGAAQAQPTGYGPPPGYDDYGPTAGGVVVSPPYRARSWNGAPVQMVRASRVVPVADLDLNSPWGQHALYERVQRAAADACYEIDMSWTRGLYPTGEDSDCVGQATQRAMGQVYGGGYY
jgi:UrcA family protein